LPVVVLHGLGGVTMHDRPYYYRTPQRWGRILISFAGPLAGFLLSAVAYYSLYYFDSIIERGSYLALFLFYVFVIGIFWGILNLMPVYPLDGGQIFREICEMVSPRKGTRASLVVSAVVAILIAMLALLLGHLFLVLLFAVLAYQSIQTLQSRRF
jgi:Predicted membrane-associated Zn-dependent proteases 1